MPQPLTCRLSMEVATARMKQLNVTARLRTFSRSHHEAANFPGLLEAFRKTFNNTALRALASPRRVGIIVALGTHARLKTSPV